VIYDYFSDEPRDIFWAKISKILQVFKISLGIEKNGVGVAHVDLAKKHGIPHFEWVTSGTTRPIMIADLEEAYRKEELIETSREAEAELRNMIYTSSNKPEAQKGKHDDMVLSRSIALQMAKVPRPSIVAL
jgi:D-ribose pyranose/furanose isomerase RbsD